jgi:nucleotide sugar dehydrogenase
MKIGFIGQGYVGKHYADDFEIRGYEVVRYALEPQYAEHKDHIHTCDVVFIAVPTPTTPEGFDYHIVEEVLELVGVGKIVVIKSTLLPGTTERIQKKYPGKVILFSPEFLCEATAAHDASNPMFNIIGIPPDSAGHRTAAEMVMGILPKSDHTFIIPTEAAELFKYTHNIHGFMRVIFSNLFYDLAQKLSVDWAYLEEIMNIDPMMSPYYNTPVHKNGRGAGGHCFIKDMAAFTRMYAELCSEDRAGMSVCQSLETKNLELLATTGKSQDLVRGVYGKKIN